MKNRWWLWMGGALAVASVAYVVWVVSPWCDSSDGESRSAGTIAAETDIVLEVRIASADVEREGCSYFVTVSGVATAVAVSDGVTVPSSLSLSFFVARGANRSGLDKGALVVVGFEERVDDEAVTSAGVVTDEDRIDWLAPTSGWRELPPTLTEWLALVAREGT